MKTTLDDLRQLAVLEGIRDEYLTPLAANSETVEFPAGARIFRKGDPATDVYLVVSGSVSLEICGSGVGCRRILTVDDGQLLGWSPVLEQPSLTATARTLAPTRAVKINGRQLLAMAEHDPRFGYEFMRRAALALAQRLSATRLQLLDVYGQEMPQTESDDASECEI